VSVKFKGEGPLRGQVQRQLQRQLQLQLQLQLQRPLSGEGLAGAARVGLRDTP
jgi:hypothetical protein